VSSGTREAGSIEALPLVPKAPAIGTTPAFSPANDPWLAVVDGGRLCLEHAQTGHLYRGWLQHDSLWIDLPRYSS
jgi:hypothetical protein